MNFIIKNYKKILIIFNDNPEFIHKIYYKQFMLNRIDPVIWRRNMDG